MGATASTRTFKRIKLQVDDKQDWFGPYHACQTCSLTVDKFCYPHKFLHCTECDNSHVDCEVYSLPEFQEKLYAQLQKQQKKINELLKDISSLKYDLKVYYIETYLQLTFMHFTSFIAIRD